MNSGNKVQFWTDNPNILMKNGYITELFPTTEMTFEQKLNAVTRLVLVITILVFIITKSVRVIVGSLFTVLAIVMLHKYHFKNSESFSNPAMDVLNKNNIQLSGNVFDKPTSSNPFSNVLVTDYEDNPQKLPAPPFSNAATNEGLMENAKKMVSEAHPDQPNITDKLFLGLNEKLNFEQSMRQFHSTASTTIPNDQGAFAEFCYGGMKSCKEGNLFACAKNMSHYNLY